MNVNFSYRALSSLVIKLLTVIVIAFSVLAVSFGIVFSDEYGVVLNAFPN